MIAPSCLAPSCSICKTTDSLAWERDIFTLKHKTASDKTDKNSSSATRLLCSPCFASRQKQTFFHLMLNDESGTAAAKMGESAASILLSLKGTPASTKPLTKISKKVVAIQPAKLIKGKSRRAAVFKSASPIRAPKAEATISTSTYVWDMGRYFQQGDVISVIDSDDGKPYYAQLRGFLTDQYARKYAALTWLLPTTLSPKDGRFDPATFVIGPEEDIPRPLDCMEFECHAPVDYFQAKFPRRSTLLADKPRGYVWCNMQGTHQQLFQLDTAQPSDG